MIEYSGTHQRRANAESEIKYKLITYNIVVSQLCNWWEDFRKFKLVDFQNFDVVVKHYNNEFVVNNSVANNEEFGCPSSSAIDFDNFISYQRAMLDKTLALMRHIWHRGAILIIKKFKLMRTKS